MWHLYILNDSCLLVPARHPWVSGRQDRRTSVERADDPGFSDGEGLLLHDLMEDGSGAIRHFVKFVNAADTVVTEDQSSTGRREGEGERNVRVCVN